MDAYVESLRRIFSSTPDRQRAHALAAPVLQDMAADPGVLPAIVGSHLSSGPGFCQQHYPVLAAEVESNPYFHLVANFWLPLPSRATDVSTKAIHHHGSMLLTTVTAYGPGYEHWTFTTPELVDPERDLFSMKLIERGPHGLGDAAFVDAYIPHLPLYVDDLSVTLALWSNREPASWRDHLKRVKTIERHKDRLRRGLTRLGMAKALDLKVVEWFDFAPAPDGFVGQRVRQEFEYGPNEDYIDSLMYIIQRLENPSLIDMAALALEKRPPVADAHARQRLEELRAGSRLEPRLSAGHYGLPHANFRAHEIERALAAAQAR